MFFRKSSQDETRFAFFGSLLKVRYFCSCILCSLFCSLFSFVCELYSLWLPQRCHYNQPSRRTLLWNLIKCFLDRQRPVRNAVICLAIDLPLFDSLQNQIGSTSALEERVVCLVM